MSIGERITELREKAGLSQAQTAQLLHVSRQAVSKWENDLSSPDTIHLIQIADLLNSDVEYIATGKHLSLPSPPPAYIVKMADREPEIVEKTIEKIIVKRKKVIKYIRNPLEYIAISLFFLMIGVFIGLMI